MENTLDVSTRDANGNRVIVDGVILDGASDTFTQTDNQGAGGVFAGAGGRTRWSTATAIGNNLQVITQGNYNTVIVNSTQTNNGDVTANNNDSLMGASTSMTNLKTLSCQGPDPAVVLAASGSLAACVSPVAGPGGMYAAPIGNAPVTSNPTPYSPALVCWALRRQNGIRRPAHRVGRIADYTGSRSDGSGRISPKAPR